MSIENEKLVSMYQQMFTIRRFEEAINDVYRRGLMPGIAHLYIGEEAVAVGICEALEVKIILHRPTVAMVIALPKAAGLMK